MSDRGDGNLYMQAKCFAPDVAGMLFRMLLGGCSECCWDVVPDVAGMLFQMLPGCCGLLVDRNIELFKYIENYSL